VVGTYAASVGQIDESGRLQAGLVVASQAEKSLLADSAPTVKCHEQHLGGDPNSKSPTPAHFADNRALRCWSTWFRMVRWVVRLWECGRVELLL
jgi:hypothetical protein